MACASSTVAAAPGAGTSTGASSAANATVGGEAASATSVQRLKYVLKAWRSLHWLLVFPWNFALKTPRASSKELKYKASCFPGAAVGAQRLHTQYRSPASRSNSCCTAACAAPCFSRQANTSPPGAVAMCQPASKKCSSAAGPKQGAAATAATVGAAAIAGAATADTAATAATAAGTTASGLGAATASTGGAAELLLLLLPPAVPASPPTKTTFQEPFGI
mmetsp:Transcript_162785/g.521787  ORF Transcript_162785/g.521787 Transcript_162785/m.521787 type:complete len:220 (-) Transcript_162785:1454-2113(-)